MSRANKAKRQHTPAPAPVAAPPASPSRFRLAVVILGVGLVIGAAAGVVVALTAPDNGPPGMVWVPGGTFKMGTTEDNKLFADAKPVHEVTVDGFWMDKHEVTNREFAEFVRATNYKTVAEIKPTLESIMKNLPPGATPPPEDVLVAGSLVFTPPDHAVPWNNVENWWSWVPGACWNHPEGPGSDIKGREDHPVVQIAHADAVAYCKWAGKRLPTEAEWEFAARGGLAEQPYVWGDADPEAGGKARCNKWQGTFPNDNTKVDGFAGTAPVGRFDPNGYGLYDMSGNVWEWCSDWYTPDYYKHSPNRNPEGPSASFDPNEANPKMPKRVQRGGSFLCSDKFCSRYKPAGRGKGDIDTGLSHLGFRCVKDEETE